MRQTFHRFYLTSMAALIAACCPAFASDGNPPSYAELPCLAVEGPVEEAVRFVEDSTGEALAGVCIKVVPTNTILDAFHSTAGIPDQHPEIGGLLVISDKTVLIPSDLDLNSAFDLSFLVHEIAHFQQLMAGDLHSDARLSSVECDAYLMQASFLRSRGLRREALIASLQAELQVGSACEY